MEQNIIYRILRKYLSSRFSPETEESVQRWLIKDQDAEEKQKASSDYWNELEVKADIETYQALERVNRKIGYRKGGISIFRQKVMRVAAVIIPLLVMAGGYMYYSSLHNSMVEICVAYGEKKHILLPDSSEIWLNAGTVFRYPKEFTDNQRRVILDGEAYFSVKRNTEKPFIVETSSLSVKVLGTKFNVKAYPDDNRITTTLTSGKVEVHTSSKTSRILRPNEQLTYHKSTSQISVTEIPAIDTDGWIQGKLIFANSSFTEIQQTLERRYNVDIASRITTPTTGRYTVRFLKNENLDEILNVLGDIIGFGYRKTGSNIELINKP